MTKEQIKALISKGIAGQGSAIDVGGVLPAILNGILDLAAEAAEKVKVLTIDKSYTDFDYEEDTIEAIAESIGITTDEAIKLFNGEYEKIILKDVVLPFSLKNRGDDIVVYGGGIPSGDNANFVCVEFVSQVTYTASFAEA